MIKIHKKIFRKKKKKKKKKTPAARGASLPDFTSKLGSSKSVLVLLLASGAICLAIVVMRDTNGKKR